MVKGNSNCATNFPSMSDADNKPQEDEDEHEHGPWCDHSHSHHHHHHNAPFVRATPKVGRNDPCPCQSGKKYKKCCGKPS